MADINSSLQDDELYLPRSKEMKYSVQELQYISMLFCFHAAVVNKLIKEIVPNIRVSTDARDLLLNCCTGKNHKSYVSVFPTHITYMGKI